MPVPKTHLKEQAILIRANLGGANLREADLRGTDLRDAKVTKEQVKNAIIDETTKR